jgi:hypothetical protein
MLRRCTCILEADERAPGDSWHCAVVSANLAILAMIAPTIWIGLGAA